MSAQVDHKTRLSRGEIAQHKAVLGKWLSPSRMLSYVDGVMDEIGSETLFNQAGTGFLTEAHAAAVFAYAVEATAVRLVDDNFPDFEIQIGDETQRFELTEADLEGRRRGEEYRGPRRIEHDPVEDWEVRAESIPSDLRRVIAGKVEQNLRPGRGTRLLVYLNINEFGIRQKQVEGSFAAATAAARDVFEEVWILWKGRPYLVWSNGGMAPPPAQT